MDRVCYFEKPLGLTVSAGLGMVKVQGGEYRISNVELQNDKTARLADMLTCY